MREGVKVSEDAIVAIAEGKAVLVIDGVALGKVVFVRVDVIVADAVACAEAIEMF